MIIEAAHSDFMKEKAATVIALAAVLVCLGSCASAPRPSRSTGDRSLYALESARIGGSRQWFTIRSADTRNPVLLFLHGGPGGASMSLLRRFNADLEERFTVVAWDQRGAGKSFHAGDDPSTLNVERILEDARELTLLLKARFGKDRIFLMGHSWGSILGVRLVAERPLDYHGYVGMGQVADMERGEAGSYAFTLGEARRRGDGRNTRRLEEMGAPVEGRYPGGDRDLYEQRDLLVRYGGAVWGESGYHRIVTTTVLTAPEYSLGEKINFIRGLERSGEAMWPQILGIDFIATVPRVEVPILLVLGRHDYNTPSRLAAEWLENLEAPYKRLEWFESSAHNPQWEEPESFRSVVYSWLDELEDRGLFTEG